MRHCETGTISQALAKAVLNCLSTRKNISVGQGTGRMVRRRASSGTMPMHKAPPRAIHAPPPTAHGPSRQPQPVQRQAAATAPPPGPPAPAWSPGQAVQAKSVAAARVGPPAPAWHGTPGTATVAQPKKPQTTTARPGPPRPASGTIQRTLRIGDRTYTSADSEIVFDKVYANCFSNDVTLITKTLSRYLSQGNYAFPNLTTFIWILNQRLLKAEKPGAFSMQQVEKNIFQYWAGGPLSVSGLNNVKGWIAKAKQNGWKHHFITDTVINEKFKARKLTVKGTFFNSHYSLEDQLGVIQGCGSQIMDAAKLPSERYKSLQKATVESGQFGEIPFMSDLARFFVLEKYGGLYMDVDVAPGSVNLGAYHTVDDIPYLGPMLRTSKEAKDAGVLGAQGETLENRLLKLFSKQEAGRGMHYMMAAKGSKAMKRIFDIANTTEILGNGAVMKGIMEHFGEHVGRADFKNIGNIMTLTMPPDLPQVGWVTAESDSTVN